MEHDVSKKYANLIAWANSNGAIIPDSFKLSSTPYGHGLTTSFLPAGPIFHIPRSIIISSSTAVSAIPQLDGVPGSLQVVVFLALEKRKDGFWKPYIQSCPGRFTTPMYFEKE